MAVVGHKELGEGRAAESLDTHRQPPIRFDSIRSLHIRARLRQCASLHATISRLALLLPRVGRSRQLEQHQSPIVAQIANLVSGLISRPINNDCQALTNRQI